jgi:hypothetical protein
MDKQAIIHELREKHLLFTAYLQGLDAKDFLARHNDKWTPGEQLDHIIRAVRPLRQAFILPTFVLKWLFGKANRPSRSYDELVAKYKLKLSQGGRASGPFIPKPVPFEKRSKLIKALHKEVDALTTKLNSLTEQDLDHYILPHPLLGKLTIREMMYFTIYHAEHHHQLTVRDLSNV